MAKNNVVNPTLSTNLNLDSVDEISTARTNDNLLKTNEPI